MDCPVEHIGAAWKAMVRTVRNVGLPGVAATAVSAVDIALWDLKARAEGLALFHLLGAYRDSVPIYGSGGFTTYSQGELIEQLAGWVEQGISKVKMKVGKDWGTKPEEDLTRVSAAHRAIGSDAELFVDANGAYTVNHALPDHPISTETVEILLSNGLEPQQGHIQRIDEDHANPRQTWLEMGSPEYLSALQVEQLQASSQLVKEPQSWSRTEGNIELHFELPPHSLATITLEFEPQAFEKITERTTE